MNLKRGNKHQFNNLKICQIVKSKLERSMILPVLPDICVFIYKFISRSCRQKITWMREGKCGAVNKRFTRPWRRLTSKSDRKKIKTLLVFLLWDFSLLILIGKKRFPDNEKGLCIWECVQKNPIFSVTFHYGKWGLFLELFKAFDHRFLCNYYFRSILTPPL